MRQGTRGITTARVLGDDPLPAASLAPVPDLTDPVRKPSPGPGRSHTSHGLFSDLSIAEIAERAGFTGSTWWHGATSTIPRPVAPSSMLTG